MKLFNATPTLSRRILQSLTLGSVIASSHSLAAIVPGDLVITEVMANPASVSDTQGEWFEIYNRSGASLDLADLVIRDDGSNAHTLSGSISIDAGDYWVLGRDGDSGLNGGYSADYEYSNFTLGNSGDEIILEYEGVVVDSLRYANDPAFGIAGVSAELTSVGFVATPEGMTFGAGDTGTPGAPGSDPGLMLSNPSPIPVPAAGWLMASALGALIARSRRHHSN